MAKSPYGYNQTKDLFKMIENYIFLYHLNQYIVLPSFVDSVHDNQPVSFSPTYPLSRSAPIYSYQYSGPRTVQVSFNLHRDLMTQINKDVSNARLAVTDDYVDVFIKYIQAAALPSYETAAKMVNPPIVAMRLGNDIFIKGIISGSVGLTYNYPILEDGRYANVMVNFTVQEIDPYDAKAILNVGSFRNVSVSLERPNTIIMNNDDEYLGIATNNYSDYSYSSGVTRVNPNRPSILEEGKILLYGGETLTGAPEELVAHGADGRR